MTPKPQLLFVSPRFLFPLDEGGKVRTVGVLRAMKDGHFHITLASPAPADYSRHSEEIAGVCDRFAPWPQRKPGILERLWALPQPLPVSVAADKSARGSRAVERELARSPGIVVVDYPHAAVLVPERLDAASVLFTHNIEAEIYERRAAVAKGALRFVWRLEAKKMRRFEQAALRRFDSVVAVSERDACAFRERFGAGNVAVIDTGVDLDFYPHRLPAETARTVVFAGVMDSRSNVDGIDFLMDEVWPLVRAARPDARMIVVGRNPPVRLVAKAKRKDFGWQFTGAVEDVRPHVLAGDISAIPLRVGSGTRLKAFEAMALGLPVVSTAVGVEGLAVTPEEHLLVADAPAAFAAAILRLLGDPQLRRRLSRTARGLLEERFSWRAVGRQFETICRRTAGASAVG